MSRHHYECSREIELLKHERDWPYYSLIMAAMRLADTENLEKLREAFPQVWQDLEARYNSPGGFLAGDPDIPPHLVRHIIGSSGEMG
jgi:hypothetical protein